MNLIFSPQKFEYGKYFPPYQASMSSYIPVNRSMTCVQKFLFNYFCMCQTVIRIIEEYALANKEANSVL